MKLNNKGFAITAVLYGLLILFVMFVSLYLLALSIKKDRVEDLIIEIEDDYDVTMDKLIDYISSLYNDASKAVVTNNGVEYNYAISVNLMNDRKGGTTSNYDAGNIRYYGDDPNNYIYFNCSDYSDQSSDTCELWRIIGIVDDKVKIIRNDSIGYLAWDQDKNQDSSLTTYSNNWETSSLQLMLNSSYYNGNTAGTITYYSGDTGTTTTSLNMSSIGIKNRETRDLISTSTWYLGGYSTSDIYPNDMYNYERTNTVGTTIYSGNPYTINANIGLMYASDYGYGTDLATCSKKLLYYDSSTCYENNWLFKSGTKQLITPSSSRYDDIFGLYDNGEIRYDRYVELLGDNVHPALYLDADIYIRNVGDGSSSNPYQISI